MKTDSLTCDIRRALGAKGFYAGAAVLVLMIAVASIDSLINGFATGQPLPNGFHGQLILAALTSDDVTMALPILCALPFTTAFVDDVKSGYIRQYLPRAGVSGYIRGKLLACGLSGGLVLVAGLAAAFALAALLLTPMELAPAPDAVVQPICPELTLHALVLFSSGAFWSLVGFTLASITMSRYMAYASPFVVYYVLIILHERYFKQFFALYPKEWLAQTHQWIGNGYGIPLLLLELTAVVGLACALVMKRRLAHV